MSKTLTAAERATIMDACQSISRSADALKDCHTVDGDWGDDVDAKAFYDAELNLLARLTALLATQQPEPRAEVTDSARLDWIAHHGISLRQDPDTKRWFLVAPYHTKIECVDSHTRFESARAAIDAARAGGKQ
ncbi:hypothetical protein HOT12_gp34 [Burkholderia phage vB_BmuP_KL4]|uniref:Uncharacterized protein n=1 Tax=Burkholderia phage vB_BmuP_KL4 TaxID=2115967 RepID=A0A2S1GN58_9CAUD|nr:hypothetical protein HOT12_gp34 [Burkholderia phage vB_BmuP_KL4]AWD90816.1 hypothetical protein [Burkholderia phage vB_BmuP_KL4]